MQPLLQNDYERLCAGKTECVCPRCTSRGVRTVRLYRDAQNKASIVSLHRCRSCGFGFTAHYALSALTYYSPYISIAPVEEYEKGFAMSGEPACPYCSLRDVYYLDSMINIVEGKSLDVECGSCKSRWGEIYQVRGYKRL